MEIRATIISIESMNNKSKLMQKIKAKEKRWNTLEDEHFCGNNGDSILQASPNPLQNCLLFSRTVLERPPSVFILWYL